MQHNTCKMQSRRTHVSIEEGEKPRYFYQSNLFRTFSFNEKMGYMFNVYKFTYLSAHTQLEDE